MINQRSREETSSIDKPQIIRNFYIRKEKYHDRQDDANFPSEPQIRWWREVAVGGRALETR